MTDSPEFAWSWPTKPGVVCAVRFVTCPYCALSLTHGYRTKLSKHYDRNKCLIVGHSFPVPLPSALCLSSPLPV